MKNLLLFVLLSGFNTGFIFAQTFIPDSTFNGTGFKSFTFFNNIDRSYGSALQPDQKLVLAGMSKQGSYFMLCFARLNTDGSLDSTFNSTGISYVSMGNQSSIGGLTPAIKITPDGKIVAVNSGRSVSGFSEDIMICRLDSNGVLDTTFNNTGTLYIDVTGSNSQPDVANALDIDANGNIYAIGTTRFGGSPLDNAFSIVKVTAAGVLDNSFDGDGKLLYDPTASGDFGSGIKVQGDGKILLGGTAQGSMLIARIDSTGAIDSSFNTTGSVNVNFGNSSEMWALNTYADGRIVIAGTKSASTSDVAVARYLQDGTPDSTFGTNGMASFDLTQTDEYANSMVLMNDNKILLGGYLNHGTFGDDFMVARLDSTGSLDSSFNNTGYFSTNAVGGGYNEEGNSIALMNDGRIYISGTIIYSFVINEDVSVIRIKEINNSTTYVETVSAPSILNAWPNPCSGMLRVSCNEKGTYRLTDVTGRIISIHDLKKGSNTIELSHLENGIYFLSEVNSISCIRFIKM